MDEAWKRLIALIAGATFLLSINLVAVMTGHPIIALVFSVLTIAFWLVGAKYLGNGGRRDLVA